MRESVSKGWVGVRKKEKGREIERESMRACMRAKERD